MAHTHSRTHTDWPVRLIAPHSVENADGPSVVMGIITPQTMHSDSAQHTLPDKRWAFGSAPPPMTEGKGALNQQGAVAAAAAAATEPSVRVTEVVSELPEANRPPVKLIIGRIAVRNLHRSPACKMANMELQTTLKLTLLAPFNRNDAELRSGGAHMAFWSLMRVKGIAKRAIHTVAAAEHAMAAALAHDAAVVKHKVASALHIDAASPKDVDGVPKEIAPGRTGANDVDHKVTLVLLPVL